MEASYLTGTSHSPRDDAVSESKSTNVGKCLLLAIGIIILVGSLVATDCLYGQIGNWSFGIGVGGLIVALVLTAIGLCYNSKTSSQPHIEEKPHSNVSQTSSVDSEEIAKKKSLNHQSIKQVPVRAADIKLSETLPQDIPSMRDISETTWLSNIEFYAYITYLATQFSGIVALNKPQLSYQSAEGFSIEELTDYVFKYLPSEFNNFNNLNLPIYLLVSGNHWTLVYIDRERRTVEYYDSKKNYGNHHEIVQKLTTIAEELSRQESDQPPYKFICKINKVLQPDSYQCCPWFLYFLENRLINPDFDFNQLNVNEAQDLIKKYRIKVMLKLIEMNRAEDSIHKQESENYLQHYKEKTLAQKMHEQDLEKIPHIDRWKQILNGQPLIPSQAL